MSRFESETLFAEPLRQVIEPHELTGVLGMEGEAFSMERVARAQGQAALFEMGIGGMYITQELF